MSILVITTMTGTFRARAMPRCSLLGFVRVEEVRRWR